MPTKPAVLVTGATYADRFARRGHGLVLVVRDKARMDELADRLPREHDAGRWDAFQAARQAMIPEFGTNHTTKRYAFAV